MASWTTQKLWLIQTVVCLIHSVPKQQHFSVYLIIFSDITIFSNQKRKDSSLEYICDVIFQLNGLNESKLSLISCIIRYFPTKCFSFCDYEKKHLKIFSILLEKFSIAISRSWKTRRAWKFWYCTKNSRQCQTTTKISLNRFVCRFEEKILQFVQSILLVV